MTIQRTFALLLAGFAATALTAVSAAADSVRIGDSHYDNVYVLDGESMYYVLLPGTGDILNVSKDNPDAHVEISANEAQRRSLYAQYKATRQANREADAEIAPVPLEEYRGKLPNNVDLADSGDDFVERSIAYTSSGVPVLTLKGDYQPSPELRARILANRTQPRTARTHVVAPPHRSTPAARAQGGFQGGGRAQGGFQSGGGGAGGFGAGGGGGFGGGGGGGGARAGGGGGGGGGAGFTNISELFTTIDDTLVGETPNIIAQMF